MRKLLVVALLFTSCAAKPAGTPTVLAASSLTEAFGALGANATFSFGASSALALQIRQGAPADVFASADETNMRKVSSLVDKPSVFARNRLEIVVAKGDPHRVTSLAGLTGRTVALCAKQVPCGTFADEALMKAHVSLPNASREENVKAVLTKVELGEADAGIVYVTDVKSARDKVTGVTIPDAENVIAAYPIAVLRNAPHHAAAVAFERLVLSTKGQRVLRSFGFMSP